MTLQDKNGGYVYLMRIPLKNRNWKYNELYKIGQSLNLKSRLQSMSVE